MFDVTLTVKTKFPLLPCLFPVRVASTLAVYCYENRRGVFYLLPCYIEFLVLTRKCCLSRDSEFRGKNPRLKFEGGAWSTTNNPVLSQVVIQNDASAIPNIVKLNGSNYPFWSKVLEMHIARRGGKRFVTGSIKKPSEGSAEYETWEIGNTIMKWWLI